MARFDPSKHPRDSRGRFRTKSSPVVAFAIVASLGYGFAADVGGVRTAVSPARSRDSTIHIETEWSPDGGTKFTVNLDYRIAKVSRNFGSPGKSRISITLDLDNHSSFAIPIDRSDQKMHIKSGEQYKAEGGTILLAAGRRTTLALVFTIGTDEQPSAITALIAGRRAKIELSE
jgi:hypothetical protein